MKTNTAQLLSRYIWLLNIIYESGRTGISRSEIDRLWRSCEYNENHEKAISRKTFYNYKCEIESLFGITLEVVRSEGQFRYRVAEEESLERNQIKQLLFNSMSMNEMLSRGSELGSHILLEDIPSSGGTNLTTILSAIRDTRVLHIVHKSFKTNATETTSDVHPYCVTLRERRWYMLAYNPDINAVRLYSLDRIGRCSLTEERFSREALAEYFKKHEDTAEPRDYFRDYYGVVIDKEVPLMDITVRVYSSLYVNLFRSLPLHASQFEVHKTEKGPGNPEPFSDFVYHIHPTIDFTRKLLSYGQFVKVLSPAQYAAEVGGIVRLAAENYN